MAITAEFETPIRRDLGDVWAALIDVERYPEWLVASGIRRVRRLEPGPIRPGSGLGVEQEVAGRAAILEGPVTVLEPGRRFGFEVKDREGISVEVHAALAPAEDGTVRLRWSLRVRLPLRYRMFESMVAPQARRAAALDLEAFRQRLEAPAAG
jgi:uncharacterized protein YndB with AHSA1/START domain